MNDSILLLILESKIVLEQLLKAGVAILLNLLANHTSKLSELTGHDGATAIALAARKALLVDLRAITLEARDWLETLGILLIAGDEKIAGDVSILDLNLHLRGLVLHLSAKAIAALVMHLGLHLGRHVVHLHTRVNHLLAGHDALRVASSLATSRPRHDVGTDRDGLLHFFVSAHSDLVTLVGHRKFRDNAGALLKGQDALSELMVANSIKLGVSGHEDILVDGAGAIKDTAASAHDLAGIKALSERAALLEVDEELIASIVDCCGDGQTKAAEVFDVEGLNEIRLRGDADDFVVFIKVVELVGRG